MKVKLFNISQDHTHLALKVIPCSWANTLRGVRPEPQRGETLFPIFSPSRNKLNRWCGERKTL